MDILRKTKYFLSQSGLLYMADKLRYFVYYGITLGKRRKFRNENPEVKLPSDYLIYESFKLDYNKYYFGGRETAKWIIDSFEKYIPLINANILDWGCGPARVVRHLPGMVPESCRVAGTDYNPAAIRWNTDNIPGVNFSLNNAEPPLPFPHRHFDGVYGISVFTHLSETMHFHWFAELIRITRPGGIILLTLQGRAFTNKLTEPERADFEHGKLVIRGNTKVGHRTWSAFHPPAFVRKLVHGHEVVGFEEGTITQGRPAQDVWTIRV